MNNRSVTILLAAYKGNAFVPAQIESILAQDTQEWRLILSDDGEDTADVLQSHADRYPDRIVHYRSGQRFGSAQKHFMHLLRVFGQEAPYTMFCDQDDFWHPDKVRKTLDKMRETEREIGADKPVLIHTDLRVVDESLQEISPSFTAFSRLDGDRLGFAQLLTQNVVTGCTVMINRPLAALSLRSADAPQIVMHDWWLALLAAAFGKAAYLPEATIDYRQHGKNVVGAKNAGSFSYLLSRLSGQYVKKMRDDTAVQAAALLKLYGAEMKEEDRQSCQAFVGLLSHGKLWRLRAMIRYGFWKNTLPRRIGQWIWW